MWVQPFHEILGQVSLLPFEWLFFFFFLYCYQNSLMIHQGVVAFFMVLNIEDN